MFVCIYTMSEWDFLPRKFHPIARMPRYLDIRSIHFRSLTRFCLRISRRFFYALYCRPLLLLLLCFCSSRYWIPTARYWWCCSTDKVMREKFRLLWFGPNKFTYFYLPTPFTQFLFLLLLPVVLIMEHSLYHHPAPLERIQCGWRFIASSRVPIVDLYYALGLFIELLDFILHT